MGQPAEFPPPQPPLSAELQQTLAAVADTIFPPGGPGDQDEPGGAALGAHDYVLRALAGPYARWASVYQQALAALDAVALEESGRRFTALGETARTMLLQRLEGAELPGAPEEAFPVIRDHVLEGVWCDPGHGGNRDAKGWALVGYPGPRLEHGVDELSLGAPP